MTDGMKKKRQWKCDNCGTWVDDDGSGNDHEGYTCSRCDSCMYPEELARLFAEGDPEAKMTWREILMIPTEKAEKLWSAWDDLLTFSMIVKNEELFELLIQMEKLLESIDGMTDP